MTEETEDLGSAEPAEGVDAEMLYAENCAGSHARTAKVTRLRP